METVVNWIFSPSLSSAFAATRILTHYWHKAIAHYCYFPLFLYLLNILCKSKYDALRSAITTRKAIKVTVHTHSSANDVVIAGFQAGPRQDGGRGGRDSGNGNGNGSGSGRAGKSRVCSSSSSDVGPVKAAEFVISCSFVGV